MATPTHLVTCCPCSLSDTILRMNLESLTDLILNFNNTKHSMIIPLALEQGVSMLANAISSGLFGVFVVWNNPNLN